MAKNEVQIKWAERFDEIWHKRYPHIVSTLGTASPRPEKVETALKITLARLPMPHHGFALWFFRTAADARLFTASLPGLMK